MDESPFPENPAWVGCIALELYNRSNPAGEVCGIPLRVCDPRALPPGVLGVVIDPENPAGAVFLVDDRSAS